MIPEQYPIALYIGSTCFYQPQSDNFLDFYDSISEFFLAKIVS